MIEYIVGNIFDSPAQVIVNPVNTVGVMGKGLALDYKNYYPDMFNYYRELCEKKQFDIGNLALWYAADHWILLFPTKKNWRNPSKLEYIEKGLIKFVNSYAVKSISSIAFPKLGCGNGELEWEEVKDLMEKYLKPLPISIYIYIGCDDVKTPEHRTPQSTMDWLKANAKDMSFRGVWDDIAYNSAIMPFTFSMDDKNYAVKCDNNTLVFTQDKHMFTIEENNFFTIWDDIRSKKVFSTPENDMEKKLIYTLLNSLGYLSKIRIKDKTSALLDGYQINEGLNRAFSLKEGLE